MPITHKESRWLITFADKIRSRIVALICESVFYGIHIILLIVAFRFLFRPDGFRSWRRIVMIATTMLMFAISTALWALDIADLMVPVGLLYEMTNAIPNFSDSNLNQWRFFAQTILYTFEFIIGDAVVVWRAYALSGSRKRVLIPLVVMLAASIGMGLYFLGCIMDYGRYLGRPKRCSRAQIATYFISLGTNFCATFVIVYQVWRYRRTMNDIAPLLKHQKSLPHRILLVLIESGFVYFVFWGVKSFTYFPSVGDPEVFSFLSAVLNSVGNQIVGLYPLTIIVLVQRQQAALAGQVHEVAFEERSRSIRFAVPDSEPARSRDHRSTTSSDTETTFGAP